MNIDVIESFARVAQILGGIENQETDEEGRDGSGSSGVTVDANDMGRSFSSMPWFLYGMNNP